MQHVIGTYKVNDCSIIKDGKPVNYAPSTNVNYAPSQTTIPYDYNGGGHTFSITEHTHDMGNSTVYIPEQKEKKFSPPKVKKIIHNGPATIVYWDDDTRTVVKCMEGTVYDEYAAFCAAVCKKIYGSSVAVCREGRIPKDKRARKRKARVEESVVTEPVITETVVEDPATIPTNPETEEQIYVGLDPVVYNSLARLYKEHGNGTEKQ